MSHQFTKKLIPLRSIAVDMDDLRRIFERLSHQLNEEADRQTKNLTRPEDETEIEFAERIANARKNAFRITVTISGNDGDELFGDTVELFSSPNLPDAIRSIYMTNVVAYKGQTGSNPPNGFSLTFDFQKPPLIDNNNPVSNPTANGSNLIVDGDRDSWVASVSEAVMGVLSKRKNKRTFLHAAFVYDAGMMILGLPLGLYLCWQMSNIIDVNLGKHSVFLTSVAYVYIVLMGIWTYRILFGYTKWAFPVVEMKENEARSVRHRYIWSTIVFGVLGNAVYEFSKAILARS
jgi:hypothetical protein